MRAIDTLLSQIHAMTPLSKLRIAAELLEEAEALDSPNLASMSASIAAQAAQEVMLRAHAESHQAAVAAGLPCRSERPGALCANCLSSGRGRHCRGVAS